jgi:hypothetical protein
MLTTAQRSTIARNGDRRYLIMTRTSASIELDHAKYVPKSASAGSRLSVSAQVSPPDQVCWRAGLIIRQS